MKNRKLLAREKRGKRIRMKVNGTNDKPRLVLSRGLRNLSAQVVDDVQAKTLFSLSTSGKALKTKSPNAGNLKGAAEFGIAFAKELKDKGITKIVFDRAGYLYHGRVKAFADALRKGGINF